MAAMRKGMMSKRFDRFLDRFWHRGAVRRWAQLAERAGAMDLDDLRMLRGRAWGLRRQLDRVLHEAEGRLALPVIGTNAILRPMGTDWAWRPRPRSTSRRRLAVAIIAG